MMITPPKNSLHKSPSESRKRQRGSAIAYALIISILGAILVGSVAQYFASFSKTVFKNADNGALRAAMNSAMDYTLNGVRNRWCFTSTWTPNVVCTLTDDKNIERLLISDEALRSIQAGMSPAAYGNDISKVRIKSMKGTVKWDDITPDHPLFYIVKGLKDIGKDFVFNFKITRVDNGVQKGREVVLQIEVELILGTGSLIKTTSDSMIIATTVMVFPREMNTNALVIANNLFLDRPDPGIAGAANGNVYIRPGSDPSVPGIQFDSPVFVNGNIYVPAPDSPVYTPVTFADKVIIGAGAVLSEKGSASYSKPKDAGGKEDRFFAQSKQFGGFLRGVLLDPAADEGLKVLGKVDPGALPDLTDADLCRLRSNAKAELSITRDAQLYLKLLSKTVSSGNTNVTGTYNFQATLGSVDFFYKNGANGTTQFIAMSPAELQATSTHTGGRPIMRATVAINGYRLSAGAYVAADLGFQSTLDIKMNPSDPTAIMRISTSPHTVGTNVQSNTVNIKVELINQERFAIAPYGVKMNGATMTTSPEPFIDVNLEAFDVAYYTDVSGGKAVPKSGRSKGEGGLACNTGAPGYNPSDTKVIPGVGTFPCYPQYHWQPVMGKYKSNGFAFRKIPGGLDQRFDLRTTSTTVGQFGGWFTCNKLDDSCPPPWDETLGKVHKPQEKDWVDFDKKCYTPPKGTDMFPSFEAADWSSTSFTDQARRSWGFTEPGNPVVQGYNPGNLVLDAANSRFDASAKPTFIVSAIFNFCTIKSNANFVTGFFVCDNLVIEPRTEPLRIIGTFIVSKMEVHQTALTSGIRWSNIFYPSSVYELRKAGILNATDVAPANPAAGTVVENCDVPVDPLWNPYPSIKRAQYLFKCNPITLRNKADPFTWTMVDPDCGLVGAKQMCKYRVMRYEIVELKRQEFL